jgi:hypothetical protein
LSLLGPAAAQPADCVASEKPLRLINLDDRHELAFHMPEERLASDTAIGRFLIGPYPFVLQMQRARKFYNYSIATWRNPIRPPAGIGWYRHPIIDQRIESRTVSLGSPPKLGGATRTACSAGELAEIPYWRTELKFYVLAEEVGSELGSYISMLDGYHDFWKPEDTSKLKEEIATRGSKLGDRIQSLEQISQQLPPTYQNQASQLLAYVKHRFEVGLQIQKNIEDPIPQKDILYFFPSPRNLSAIPYLTQLRILLEADLPGTFTYGSSELNRMIEFEIQLANAGAELPDLNENVKNRAKTASLDNLKIALANLQEIPFDSPDVLAETSFSLTTYRGCIDAFEQAQTADTHTPVKYVQLWMTVTAKCLCFEYARSRYREFLLSRL